MEDHWVIMKAKFCGTSTYVYGPFTKDDADTELKRRVDMYGDGSKEEDEFIIKMVKEV